MLSKEQLLNSIKDMPDRFSFDELLDRVLLLQKIEVGLEQSDNGNIKSNEEAKQMLAKWLQ